MGNNCCTSNNVGYNVRNTESGRNQGLIISKYAFELAPQLQQRLQKIDLYHEMSMELEQSLIEYCDRMPFKSLYWLTIKWGNILRMIISDNKRNLCGIIFAWQKESLKFNTNTLLSDTFKSLNSGLTDIKIKELESMPPIPIEMIGCMF